MPTVGACFGWDAVADEVEVEDIPFTASMDVGVGVCESGDVNRVGKDTLV
jgi:hypothetical protein